METTSFMLGSLPEADRQWLQSTGQLQQIAAGTVLIREGEPVHHLYLVLEGQFAVSVSRIDGTEQPVVDLDRGEVLGAMPFMDARLAATTITAGLPSTVLCLSHSQLSVRLRQDQGFAARFYQAIAVLFSNRLRALSSWLVQSQAVAGQPLRKVLFVFAELHDGDIDWLITAGQPWRSPAGSVLIQTGEPADALYILLEGSLAVSVTALVDGVAVTKQVATLASGEIIGEMSFIDAQLPSATVSALEGCFVLALPRTQLAERLHRDVGFATRFYRAIALILSDRLQDRLTRFGYSKLAYDRDQPLDEELEYEDELDVNLLDHVALAGARFDWLLRRFREKA